MTIAFEVKIQYEETEVVDIESCSDCKYGRIAREGERIGCRHPLLSLKRTLEEKEIEVGRNGLCMYYSRAI